MNQKLTHDRSGRRGAQGIEKIVRVGHHEKNNTFPIIQAVGKFACEIETA